MPEPNFAALRRRLDAVVNTPTALATIEILNQIGDAVDDNDESGLEVRGALRRAEGIALLRVSDARPSNDPLIAARWAAQHAFAMLWALQSEKREAAITAFVKAADRVFDALRLTGESVIGTIYFIRHNGHTEIKIGYATSLKARLATFETGTPYGIELLASHPGTVADEAALHERFADLRISGNREWFQPGIELLAHINSL